MGVGGGENAICTFFHLKCPSDPTVTVSFEYSCHGEALTPGWVLPSAFRRAGASYVFLVFLVLLRI